MQHAAQLIPPSPQTATVPVAGGNSLPASAPAVAGRAVVAVAVSGRVVSTVNRSGIIDAGSGDKGDDRCRIERRRHDVGAAVPPRWSVTVVTIASTAAGASIAGRCRQRSEAGCSPDDQQLAANPGGHAHTPGCEFSTVRVVLTSPAVPQIDIGSCVDFARGDSGNVDCS